MDNISPAKFWLKSVTVWLSFIICAAGVWYIFKYPTGINPADVPEVYTVKPMEFGNKVMLLKQQATLSYGQYVVSALFFLLLCIIFLSRSFSSTQLTFTAGRAQRINEYLNRPLEKTPRKRTPRKTVHKKTVTKK